MSRRTIAFMIMAGCVAAGAALGGGGVWVEADGSAQELAGGAFVFGEEGVVVDLSSLADGETRVFGSGDRQLTAVREGDRVQLTREGGEPSDALALTCRIGADVCQVVTHGAGDRVALLINKTRECVNGHGDCEAEQDDLGSGGHVFIKTGIDRGAEAHWDVDTVHLAEPGQSTFVIRSGVPSHALGDLVRLSHIDGDVALLGADATLFDLSELLDGETRIFGDGGGRVIAVREADAVRIITEPDDEGEPRTLTCRLGQDHCRVATFEQDSERVIVMVHSSRPCGEDEASCGAEILDLDLGGAVRDGRTVQVIEVHEDDDAEPTRGVRRIRVISDGD